MKILMLIESMDRGGAETHVLTLASSLIQMGNSVCVASAGGTLVPYLRERKITHTTLPLGSHKPTDILFCRRTLRRMLKNGHFDIVHSHSRLASVIVAGMAQKYGARLVCTAHAKFKVNAIYALLAKWGDVTLAVGEDLKQYLSEEYGTPPENVTVIPNGVDAEVFCSAPIVRKKARSTAIAFLSRLDADCSLGAKLLCRVAYGLYKRGYDIKIIIGGSGNDLESVRKLAESTNAKVGCEIISCPGEIDDVPKFMRACDIFVGVSRAAIEAGLCSRPVILCGNEGFGGRLTEENFESAISSNFCARGEAKPCEKLLGNALSDLLTEGEGERTARAERVRRLLLENCSAHSMALLTEKAYRRALNICNGGNGDTLLCGYYGYANAGDDALLRAAIERSRREYPTASICALTRRGRHDREIFGVACAKRSSPLSLALALLRCRRLIFGGGTLLQCNTSLRSMAYYALLLRLGKLLGKECILWGNGIGRIEGKICKKMLRCALGSCSFIGMRDARSYAIAKSIAPSARTVLESDLAEGRAYILSSTRRAEYLLRKALGCAHGNFVIAIPRARCAVGDQARMCASLAKASAKGLDIVIIPMCEHEDLRACAEMREALGCAMLRGICFDDLILLAKKSRAVYSMRYHGLVAAKIAGVDFIGVGNDEKLTEYCLEQGAEMLQEE